jgi:epsilon-lactone hydrolase
MLDVRFNRKTIRGSLARQLLKMGQQLSFIKKHGPVDFGRIYTTKLSVNFVFPKKFVSEWITYKTARMERISLRSGKSSNIILQFHGGAYVSGYSDVYRRSAIKYFNISCGTDVISLDYRLAPAYPYPAALEDAVAAYEYLLVEGYHSDQIMIVGDSAGGGLALALGLYLRDHEIALPRAIITMSAWTDLAQEGESYLRNRHLDPLLGEGTQPLDVLAYAGSKEMIKHPYISPAYGNYEDFTTLMMHVGTDEVLESDTLTVAKKAANAGNQVTVTMYRGMFHVFQLAFDLIPEAKKSWNQIRDFIQHEFGCARTKK